MTESQKAFEDIYRRQYSGNTKFRFFFGKYYYIKHQEKFEFFQYCVAYGRKQALEELKAAFLKFENNKVAQLEIVKELIK
jgi:hypothetical protein